MSAQKIEISTVVHAPVQSVWRVFTDAEHVRAWNHASDDWHCPAATSDLREGGSFTYTMAAKDGSESFDFSGTYTEVLPYERLTYALDDDRLVEVHFAAQPGGTTRVTESFDAEEVNPVEMQLAGWQAILDNFRDHAESGS